MAGQVQQQRVVIGMDPHKRSVTIEMMTGEETILGRGRYATDEAGFAAMRADVRKFDDRVWAIEGCRGIGRHVAQRLLAAGEEIVDVPPKLSAEGRVHATSQGRKTDATDAHSIALAGTRVAGLRPVVAGRSRCAAAAGRPPPSARRGAHSEDLPTACLVARADSRRGEEGPVCGPGQAAVGEGPAT